MDLLLVEEGDGGDLVKTRNDLQVIEGLQNMAYLAMFGGNVAASSTNKRLATEQDFSWWGNLLTFPNNQDLQFNSETERALMNTPLTSSGRTIIEQAVKTDLKFMKDFCRVSLAVSIVATDKIVIGIRLQQPDNLQERQFIYIWDATRSELTMSSGGSGVAGGPNQFFEYTLDFQFI